MSENASLKIWNALEPLIKREIERQTRSCQRMKSMTVSTAYNGSSGLVGVKEAFGSEIFLPVMSTVDKSRLVVGASVWVCMPYSSMSNAIVMMMGDGNNGYSAKELIGAVYPVGSLYMSVNGTDPGTLFGGTWERLKDRFLLAAGDTYAAGATGGEATHTLTVSEMPSHNHTYMIPGNETGTSWYDANGTAKGATQSSGDSGGSAAHNNMPPYIAVYVWKRTA